MKNFSILVIDDELNVVDILSRAAETIFPEAFFQPLTSFSEAVEYLERLKGPAPKLIILDVDLHTDLSGLDLLKALRQHPKGRLLPVVVLTSNVNRCREAYDLGASSVIGKPYAYKEWREMVSRLREYWGMTVTIPELWIEEELVLAEPPQVSGSVAIPLPGHLGFTRLPQ